jgi:hypothetical protein
VSFERAVNAQWTQEHSLVVRTAPFTDYPTTLHDLIGICADHEPDQRLHAAGSHWALSDAPLSDHTFIETNDPLDVRPAIQQTLKNIVPGCLTAARLNALGGDTSPTHTFVHVEAGKRIYQLYAELDQVDSLSDPTTLAGHINQVYNNPAYAGPWGFATLGGAGGQTVVGALTTGTHGGDFNQPPLADAVVAIHLVADGGKQWWIEPRTGRFTPLADEALLRAQYAHLGEFELKRDDDLFNAVLVSAGRFGVIYSVVLTAVPQYSIYERVRLTTWQELKAKDEHTGVRKINDLNSFLYNAPSIPPDSDFRPSTQVVGDQRFLQIAVLLTTHANFTKNLAGVTQRWSLELPTAPMVPQGRAERVGGIADPQDPRLQGTLFELAGNSHTYHRPDETDPAPRPTFLESACSNASFLRGLVETTRSEIGRFVETHGAEVGIGIATIAELVGTGILALIPALLVILALLDEFLDAFDDETPLGAQVDTLRGALLVPGLADPALRDAGLLTWQMIANELFRFLQKKNDYEAISYAVMDIHDYLDQSCFVKGYSVEVFFDATDDRLIAFIDQLIAFEKAQELQARAFVGYASLRFTQRSAALLGMQRWRTTCSIEVAGLAGVPGSKELVEYAALLARKPTMGAVLHWGQHNDYMLADVERLFGDRANPPASPLGRWRQALSLVTDNGRLDGFSSQFTRDRGLEVITPAIRSFHADPASGRVGESVVVSWDASNNPRDSSVTVTISTNDGEQERSEGLPVTGSLRFPLTYPGEHVVEIDVLSGADSTAPPARAGTIVTAVAE